MWDEALIQGEFLKLYPPQDDGKIRTPKIIISTSYKNYIHETFVEVELDVCCIYGSPLRALHAVNRGGAELRDHAPKLHVLVLPLVRFE